MTWAELGQQLSIASQAKGAKGSLSSSDRALGGLKVGSSFGCVSLQVGHSTLIAIPPLSLFTLVNFGGPTAVHNRLQDLTNPDLFGQPFGLSRSLPSIFQRPRSQGCRHP
jgi:hypothetical protein